MKLIAIGPLAWGKSDTVSKAVRNCKANIPWRHIVGDSHEIRVYLCPDGTRINGSGGLVIPEGGPDPVEVDVVKVRRPRTY